MKVLVVGSGGREHALCWALSKSPLIDALYCAPGNGGIAEHATCFHISASDIDGLIAFSRSRGVDLVVVGPEAPLVGGLVDRLGEVGIAAFGPSARAAALEGSKGFTKDLCAKAGIPTARYGRFADAEAAKAYVGETGAPIVVKADGLAAGKGVIMAQTVDEAECAIDEIFAGRFGAAGTQVVVEEFLVGEEASFLALVDGEHVLALATAQDHKAVGEGDTGPNTGGMGAYSPAPVMTPTICDEVMTRIIEPTVRVMKAEGRPYRGVLYAGLMITDGGPQLLEYNVRFGDPECQVLLTRLKSDLFPALLATRDGRLDEIELDWDPRPAVTVVMAATGYPGAYEKGGAIGNLEAAGAGDDIVILHAGTRREGGAIVAAGGRVLSVTAVGATVAAARDQAYQAVDAIDWPGGFCRRDIGWRAVAREQGDG